MFYSREATANRVPGHPLILAAGGTPGRLVSTPVLENGEVAAAARGGGGDDDNDDDNNDDNDDKDGNNERKQNHRVGASYWCLELNADATTGGWQV